MKMVDRLAKEWWIENRYTEFSQTEAFKAGWDACRRALLGDLRWDATNWVEIPKEKLEKYGEIDE